MVSPSRKGGQCGYEMPKGYVLRCERNWVLESESGKEEHCIVVEELCDVLEKFFIDFGKLFQRIGEVGCMND